MRSAKFNENIVELNSDVTDGEEEHVKECLKWLSEFCIRFVNKRSDYMSYMCIMCANCVFRIDDDIDDPYRHELACLLVRIRGERPMSWACPSSTDRNERGI